MTIKINVKDSTIYPNTKVIYTDNDVTKELVEKVQELLKECPAVRVSFDVTGETLHTILSNQLKFALRDISKEYVVEVGRYKCLIWKVAA